MATLAFEPLRATEQPSPTLASPNAVSCFPFAHSVDRTIAAQCRPCTAEECSGMSPAEGQPAAGGSAVESSLTAEDAALTGQNPLTAAEGAEELLLLDWIIDGSEKEFLSANAVPASSRRTASHNFESPPFSPAASIGGNSSLRGSASDRNLGGLCGDARARGKREFRRSCSMEDINSSSANGGGGRGGKPGARNDLESSPSSVLTRGPSSPTASVDSCASDGSSPISSPVKVDTMSARPRTLHLPPLPPKIQVRPWQQVTSFGAPLLAAVPSARPQPQQHQQGEGQQRHTAQLAEGGCAVGEAGEAQVAQAPVKPHPLLVLDEQRRKHRAWMSLFSPSLAQSLTPLAPPENHGAERRKTAEPQAHDESAGQAEATQPLQGDCARDIDPAAGLPLSAFCAEVPAPPQCVVVPAPQPGFSSVCFANEFSSDELAGDVTQAIRQGLGAVTLGTAAGSRSGQENFGRAFSSDECGLTNRNATSAPLRRTSSDLSVAAADHRNVLMTRPGACTDRTLIMMKPSNLRGGAGRQVPQGQKKVRWGADEVFEIPARCSSVDF
ncbi:hypothetical protein CLOP_g6408 [Closterium sp. NIES-67]|nr:hypothetical protein CLOP_g6408 [Closterium sp. NIES-67]